MSKKEGIMIRSYFYGWREVSEEQAWNWAVHLFQGMMCENKTEKINNRIKGMRFTEDELFAEWNRRRTQGIE